VPFDFCQFRSDKPISPQKLRWNFFCFSRKICNIFVSSWQMLRSTGGNPNRVGSDLGRVLFLIY
jgi:hypothetical protein